MNDARWFFRRKTGYMSPYLFRTVIRIIRTYPKRGLPLDPVFLRIGKRYIGITFLTPARTRKQTSYWV